MLNFSVTPSEAPNIPRDGLLFWFDPIYQFNSSNPQTSYDRSGNFGTITFSNSPTILPATDSLGGLDFDGTNDNILTPIKSPSLSQVTWVLWLRREASQVAYAGIFYNRVPGRSDNVAGLHFANTGTTANRLRFTYNNNNFDTESSLIPPLNSWVMISCALDSTGVTYSMFGSGSSTINSRMAITNHASLTFTHSWIAYDGFSSRYFAGSIGLCLLYSRVLSTQELTNIYEATGFRYERLIYSPPATTTTTTTTTTSTTTVAPYYKFTGVKGSDSSEACGGGEADDAYSNVTWAGLKANDVLFEDSSLTVTWQKSQFFKKDDENQWIEIDTSNGKVLGKPADCK